MRRGRQLFTISAVVIGMSSAVDHVLLGWLGIADHSIDVREFGDSGMPYAVKSVGSSLSTFAVDWAEVARDIDEPVLMVGFPGGSPVEFESVLEGGTDAGVIVLGVSVYDLDEGYLSDFRSVTTSLRSSVRDLAQSDRSWSYSKRVLSQYPMQYLRFFFPTVGRSTGVMVGLRTKLNTLLRWMGQRSNGTTEREGLTLTMDTTASGSEPLSDWTEGRRLRNISRLRVAARGQNGFNGPKSLALERIIGRAAVGARLLVIVLPVSPTYSQALVDEEELRSFETLVDRITSDHPEVTLARIDEIESLRSDAVFWDLIHLDTAGRDIATRRILEEVKKIRSTP